MPPKPEHRQRYFEHAASQRHIQAPDRYLYNGPTPHLNIAVIGTGTIGLEHMRVTYLEGRAKIHGIFDPHPASIEMALTEFAKLSTSVPVVYDSLTQACQDPAIDALIICTPNHTHLDVLTTAIESGKPILLEKPMATTIRDAAQIVRIANQYSSLLQIGLQYRYKPIYVEAMHEILQRESVGTVKTISLMEHRPPFLDKVGQWNKFACYSGGTLIEKCCHYFDLMNLFSGSRPSRVFASGGQAVNFADFKYAGKQSDIADHSYVTVDYRNGSRASLDLNMFCPNFYEELVVCGDRGRLKAFEEFKHLHSAQINCGVSVELGESGASRHVEPRYPDFIEQSGHHGSTYFEHQRFVDAIDGRPTDSADIRAGFWSVLQGAAAELSMTERRPIDIDELIASNYCRDITDG